jgi:hypothetical protein
MDETKFVEHKGKRVLCVNLTGITDTQTAVNIIEAAKNIIRMQPQKSLLIATDVSNSNFNSATAAAIKEFAAFNTRFVKAGAVIGITGLKKLLYDVTVKLAGRYIGTFNTLEDALDWLVKQ